MPKAVARTRTLRPEKSGLIHKQVGYLIDHNTGLPTKQQPKFNLGRDRTEAEYRHTLIRQLYAKNCRCPKWGGQCWSPLALSYAKLIAEDVYTVPFDVPPGHRRVGGTHR